MNSFIKRKINFWFMTFVTVCVVLGSSKSMANGEEVTFFRAGQHYKKLPERILHRDDIKTFIGEGKNKVHVMMFFSYGCYWCGHLNKPFNEWVKEKPNNVKASMLPVVFRPNWDILAKAFFTAHILDNTGELDDSIFTAIHEQHLPMRGDKAVEDFFVAEGFDREKFRQTFNSFSVNAKVKQADDLSLSFEIDATPNIIVYGPKGAYITNLTMMQERDELFDKLFKVVDFLVKKVS